MAAATAAANYSAMVGSRAGTAAAAGTQQHGRWSPYELNGGTSLGIAGDDFAVIAADTRLSEGYSIMTREIARTKVLTPKCAIATGGCHTDVHTLHKLLGSRVDAYSHAHGAEMSCTALAQMLSNTLYYRRMMPYYAFNVRICARLAFPRSSPALVRFIPFVCKRVRVNAAALSGKRVGRAGGWRHARCVYFAWSTTRWCDRASGRACGAGRA